VKERKEMKNRYQHQLDLKFSTCKCKKKKKKKMHVMITFHNSKQNFLPKDGSGKSSLLFGLPMLAPQITTIICSTPSTIKTIERVIQARRGN